MLAGTRPAECDYCWRIEDTPGDHPSDRHIKSSDAWAEPEFDLVRTLPWDADVGPSYMEVSFSSACNMKCSYCSPKVSSKWMEEIRLHGPYAERQSESIESLQKNGEFPIPENEPNPYVEAFWKWWPQLNRNLKVFRITGGEPLLSKDTFRVLEFIAENPRPELELMINSNLSVPDELIDQLVSRLRPIAEKRKAKQVTVYTSLDAWGPRAEYIRHGMDLGRMMRNVDRVLSEVPGVKLTFMCTFNALSVTSFESLLEAVLALKKKFPGGESGPRVFFDIAYLRHPDFMSIKVLTPDYARLIEKSLLFMEAHSPESSGEPDGFTRFEIAKMRRTLDWMLQPESKEWLAGRRSHFRSFFTEHDRRRKTSFERVFTEMSEFWELCARPLS